jgi:hypothetical protein
MKQGLILSILRTDDVYGLCSAFEAIAQVVGMLTTHLADLVQEGGFVALAERDEGDDGERSDDKGGAEVYQEGNLQEDEEF